MKRIIYPVIVLMGIWFMVSCNSADFLDETVTTDLDEATVFSDSTYTTAFLTDIYTNIGFASNFDRFNDWGTSSGGLQTACDEAEPRQLSAITTDVQFATGTVNSVIVDNSSWIRPYENIRKVNQLLKHLPEVPIAVGRKEIYAAEARFLRAWYYFVLVRHYGGVPLIGDVVYTRDDEINTVRNTFAECVDYIVSECDEAAKVLPNNPSGRERGHAGAGACMALKARVLLYAASPLYNGSDFASEFPDIKPLLGYPEYSAERWKLARDAARQVISMNAYSLYIDNAEEAGRGFYRQYIPSDWVADGAYSGTILEHKRAMGRWRENLFQPPSRGGGGGGWPYQELVDAFPMKNGKAITDPNSGYDPNDPYANRDPRLFNSIVYDQVPLRNASIESVPVNIYLGNYNGQPSGQDAVYTGTPTGYYFKKQQHKQAAANYFIEVNQARPLMRYAELLLNYAEAQNEYEGPTTDVFEILKNIRERAGIEPGEDGMYGIDSGMNQEAMREFIQNERRVELAIEGFRIWDVRRWMIAEQTDNKTMHGMEITRNGEEASYKTFEVRKRIFRKAMYFWPIPYAEVAKSPELVQNPYY
ncbi:RagB/SusD family nutrient uptake outer membrane protein [uncultured Draconibacterium sp.]|uniref:RagB/SusD family nutrient uptake outer membrane protein n=1 Tax=uncultured Draconibacterium sp. TaxID=1573823 RepID=UPI0029C94865|nr:RagB/SusD family nutrient uptake outer membrane protein [uncultured Draconibacterium sp.]